VFIAFGLLFLLFGIGGRGFFVINIVFCCFINFVSSNVYLCVEINAHSLIMILIKLKRENRGHLLLPSWLFGSQPAEGLFRLLRSLSPMESTNVLFYFNGM